MMAKPKKLGPIRSAILSWLGVPLKLTDANVWEQILGGNNATGICVSPDRAMQMSAVWACVRLISETIATLPFGMYEKTATGKRPATQHPLHFLIHDQPNSQTTSSVHWEATVAAMLLRGNGRAEKLMIGGRVVGLQFLNPARLSCSLDGRGRRVWRYNEAGGRHREIPDDRIFNIPGFSLDGYEGVSAVRYGAEVFGAAVAADEAAGKTFKNGLHPTVAFKYPQIMKEHQREEARAMIKKISGAVNAGEPAIFEAGTDAMTIGIDPRDAQLLESRNWGVEEICRWFRVPPHMVGHTQKDTSWGSGIEQQMIGFLTFTLRPWLRRIEQAVAKDLMTPADRLRFYPKFSVEGLLRADSAGRAAFFTAMVNNGVFTRDEVRELEDREPMGGNAGVLTVQSAMTTLDGIGQADAGNAARAAIAAWLREDDAPRSEDT